MEWDYDELTDEVFRMHYRMEKTQFKKLCQLVKLHLPGWTLLSRIRQAAAGGNPIFVVLLLQESSTYFRYLAGWYYCRKVQLNQRPGYVGSKRRFTFALVKTADSSARTHRCFNSIRTVLIGHGRGNTAGWFCCCCWWRRQKMSSTYTCK